MERIIRDLLDYTRTRARKGIPLCIGAADAGEICARVVAEAGLSDRAVPVELHRAGDLTGEWDADRLEQAVGNLVANALRHAPPGTSVRLRATGEEERVRIDVENDGSPIPPEAVRSLFDPFHRSDGGGPAGLGLGLFIVRTILDAHGGTVDVESTGAPVTFTIRLPRRQEAVRRDTSATFWRPARRDRRPGTGKTTTH
jgi:signal transduction histidine kinase